EFKTNEGVLFYSKGSVIRSDYRKVLQMRRTGPPTVHKPTLSFWKGKKKANEYESYGAINDLIPSDEIEWALQDFDREAKAWLNRRVRFHGDDLHPMTDVEEGEDEDEPLIRRKCKHPL
ncbi:hypothetical protein BG011_002524, partial [Mortierella polycephala]